MGSDGDDCEGSVLKYVCLGTSLAVQWLRLALPLQGVRVRSLFGELRCHVPRSAAKKKKKCVCLHHTLSLKGQRLATPFGDISFLSGANG